MANKIDMTGLRFGRLVVIEQADDIIEASGRHRTAWRCLCDCGKDVIVRGECLRSKSSPTRSCGCLSHDQKVLQHMTHGQTYSKLYGIWCSIKSRCYNPNTKPYQNYGGRGITMCDEWKNSFESFSEWAVHNGYGDGLSIDRVDNDGNYCPDNCRWVDGVAQANNRRTNRLLTYNGQTMNITQWAKQLGISPKTLFTRVYAGYSVEQILST